MKNKFFRDDGTKEEWDEFAKTTIPKLRELGYIKERTLLYVLLTFVVTITLSGVIFYGIQVDGFKSNVNQSVSLEPNINVNPTTENKYEFSPKNNFTIVIEKVIVQEYKNDSE